MTNHYDVIIIGAGAAGLMCAITAGQRGRRVLVVDHANKAGKKILMSGGGRCNFTNLYVEPDCFLSRNPHFCKSALNQYTQWDFIDLVCRHNIPYHEKKLGQLFCDNKSSDILNMLLAECEQAGVDIQLKTAVESVEKKEGGFSLVLEKKEPEKELQAKEKQSCESLVIATGGLSIPTMGATGFGYELAKQFELEVLPQTAALVPFIFTDEHKVAFAELSGISLPVEISCAEKSFSEDLLFTHRGLSGPAVLQLSSYWQSGEPIYIDLLPGKDVEGWLLDAKRATPQKTLHKLMVEAFAKKFAGYLSQVLGDDKACGEKPLQHFSDSQLKEIAQHLSQWQLKPSGTEGYRTAEVTLGGVNTDELSSKTMEAKKVAGLYFVGEVVDVTGHLGGFNFQWAWSSGYVAGMAA